MIKKKTKLNRFLILCTISILILIVNNIFTSQSNLGLIEGSNKLKDENLTKKSLQPLISQLPEDVGGYNSLNIANFKTLENASSTIYKRDFLANESNYFNITTPQAWNASSMQFTVDPYSKKQIIQDPNFQSEYEGGPQYWDEEKVDSGFGYFSQYSLESYPYGITHIYNLKERDYPGFYQGDHAYWTQECIDLNPEDKDIKKGKIIQEKDEQVRDFDNFETDPSFYKDLDTPYGGEYDPIWDVVDLYYDESITSLSVLIEPSRTSLGGNPSAAWWYYIIAPYEIDYAQIKITWNIDEASSFEAEDEYEVIARINNKYIDGRNPIAESGEDIPFNGSSTALMVYDNPEVSGHIRHGTVSRTYNITDLIDGLIGINKFDFGVWAKNPSHLGDEDLILANFESIEIMFNTTTKYEVASLGYRYKLIDADASGSNPFLLSNDASLFLYLRDMDTDQEELIRVLPFSITTISYKDFSDSPWINMNFSISDKYQEFLKADRLEFKIGVYFENDFYDRSNYYHFIDNVTFRINYDQSVTNPQLRIRVDNSPTWENVTNSIYTINTSNWLSGDPHSFQFTTFNLSYQNRLYLNVKSDLELNYINDISNGAKASYYIRGANSSKGMWNVTYDNTISYTYLLLENFSPSFNLSSYSISFLDMPAFDFKGSNSSNWEILNAISPDLEDFSSNLVRYNYSEFSNNQSALISGAYRLGNWSVQGTQPNYITDFVLNASDTYLGLPQYYTDEIVQYNFSVLESTNGYYSIALYNSTGALMSEFPQHFASSGSTVIGTIDLAEKYGVGQYYLYVKWNDTTSFPGRVLRLGSTIQSFVIFNNSYAQFTKLTSQVDSGLTAEFALNYTTYKGWGIPDATILVLENSTGNLKFWGVAWSGAYQVGEITYKGNGNYSIPLKTTLTPNGTYSLFFYVSKFPNKPQVLTTSLKVIAVNTFDFNITEGAYLNNSEWIINSDNVPYVNDTINSVIRINLTDSGIPITGGSVIGHIGESESFFEAQEIGYGLYDLTLDTTGFNATQKIDNKYIENKTLEIRCSAGGYNLLQEYVTIFIDKIPTTITLQNIENVYEEGIITASSIMENHIDSSNPQPNNHGSLKYYIFNETSEKLNGSLDFLLNGVYQKDISLSGLSAGEYSIYINGTAFNCENSKSNVINFTILAQFTTNLEINVPETLRISKEFQIKTTLSYAINGTPIQGQTIYLNISIGQEESFLVTTTTDSLGISTYNYIISSQFKDLNITIEAIYQGQQKIAASHNSITKTIYGKLPIQMEIYDFPSVIRVGYSATYGLRINISDSGETLQNKVILFSAYYNEDFTSPIITFLLYTDVVGQCEYTITEIEDKNDNITVYFEYLGSTTLSYNITSRMDIIVPKWSSNFTVHPLPSIIRHGQTIEFDMSFSCENTSITLQDLPVHFIFNYEGTTEIYTTIISINNTLVYLYQVADSFNGNLNCSIIFEGTNRIAGVSLNFSLVINPKSIVQLSFIDTILTQYMQGSHSFHISVENELGELLDGLLIRFQIINNNGEEISNYTAICENGIAVGSLDLPLGNNYRIRVQFLAESYYEGAIITSERIRVVNELIIFLDYLPYILLALGITAATLFTVYRAVIVPRRRRRIESLKLLYQKLSDVENLQYLIVLTKDGGVPCYSKSLADVPIDETLVSGFLSAISTFGTEIGKKIQEGEGGLEELSYRQFKIIINEGKFIRVALLLLKRPSESLKVKLRNFNKMFEEVYESELKSFSGQVFDDIAVTKLIEDVFEADLLYPHQVIETKVDGYMKSSTSNNIDKKIIIIARGEEFESNFYLRDIINHLKTKGIEEIKSFDSIQKMKQDKIVFAINPRTNYLIEDFKRYIKHMNSNDRNVLFAIFDGNNDILSIRKYMKKANMYVPTDIHQIVEKLRRLHLIDEVNRINEQGSAIATLLKLIPDL
ncbi:MAG: hypothetical protein ACFFCV_04060 [Promethearchaeota archaeon]